MVLAKQPKRELPGGKEHDQYLELVSFISQKERRESSLIECLHFTQRLFGYIPKPAQVIIAEMLDLPATKVYGVVTFYSYFTENPTGKFNISICLGTACYVKGAGDIVDDFEDILGIQAGQTTEDGLFTITPTRCLGECSRAPVVMVNDQVFGHVTRDEVREMIKLFRDQAKKESGAGPASLPAENEVEGC